MSYYFEARLRLEDAFHVSWKAVTDEGVLKDDDLSIRAASDAMESNL